jgi:hypothetical protein
MTSPADNPLALATFDELVAEIKARCTNFVLIHDRPLKTGDPKVHGQLDMNWATDSVVALGLLQYAKHQLLRRFDRQPDPEHPD